MRAPISGLLVAMRPIKGGKGDPDVGELDIVQVGDSKLRTALIHVYVEDMELFLRIMAEHGSGSLRWIDLFCYQVPQGRELLWMLERVYGMEQEPIPVES